MESKTIRTKGLLYRLFLDYIRKGFYPAQIAKECKVTRQAIQKVREKAEKQGHIRVRGRYNTLDIKLTQEGHRFLKETSKPKVNPSWGGVRERFTSRIHSIRIKYPILRYNKGATLGGKKYDIKNQVRETKRLYSPTKITLEWTSKSIIANIREITAHGSMFDHEFHKYVRKSEEAVYLYCKKRGILIDKLGGEIIAQEMASDINEYDKEVPKSAKIKIPLGRKSKSVLKTNLDASAWIDRSLGPLESETNDLAYAKKLAIMPETVHELGKTAIPLLKDYNKNLKLHIAVMEDMRKTLRDIRASTVKKRKRRS